MLLGIADSPIVGGLACLRQCLIRIELTQLHTGPEGLDHHRLQAGIDGWEVLAGGPIEETVAIQLLLALGIHLADQVAQQFRDVGLLCFQELPIALVVIPIPLDE